MTTQAKRLMAILAAAAFVSSACFASNHISTTELGKLQTGYESENLYVATDGCADDQPLSGQEPIDGRDPDTGCEVIRISGSNTVYVDTRDGESYRVTPYNFTLSETQLVAPDYDLLLARDTLGGARVETLSTGRTVALICGMVAAAAGTFLVISLTAGESRGLGGQ